MTLLRIPTGRRHNSWLIQAWPTIWTRGYRETIQEEVRWNLNPGLLDCKSYILITRLHCLQLILCTKTINWIWMTFSFNFFFYRWTCLLKITTHWNNLISKAYKGEQCDTIRVGGRRKGVLYEHCWSCLVSFLYFTTRSKRSYTLNLNWTSFDQSYGIKLDIINNLKRSPLEWNLKSKNRFTDE